MAHGQKKKRIPKSRFELAFRTVMNTGGLIKRAQEAKAAKSQTQAPPQEKMAEPEPETKITPPTN
jgi:hypothetical protein